MEETFNTLDRNMKQFETVIYDIEDRLQVLERSENELRVHYNSTIERFLTL